MSPDNWRRVCLSEVADQRAEKIIPIKTDQRPYVALEHLAPGRPVLLGWSAASIASSAKTVFRRGDVLFGKLRPYLRKAAPAPFDGICSTDILPLFCRNSLDALFLIQLVQWNRLQQHAIAMSSGTKMPRTSWTQLGKFEFSLPPFSEQRRIAVILSSVDEVIEKAQAVIDQVQSVKRGLMQELLTQGIPGRHMRVKQTEIGEIPEEWDLQPAATVCERIVVGIVVKPAQYYATSGVPCLRSLNVQEDWINDREMKYISHDSNRQLRKSQLKSGDVVTVRTGYPGTSAVIPERLNGANCVDLIISTPGPRISGAFLSRFINSERGRAAVAEQKGGLAQQHFNVGAMKAMLTPIPSLQEQNDICDVLQSLDQRLNAETESLYSFLSLKSALMSVLLTGELRVTPETEVA